MNILALMSAKSLHIAALKLLYLAYEKHVQFFGFGDIFRREKAAVQIQ